MLGAAVSDRRCGIPRRSEERRQSSIDDVERDVKKTVYKAGELAEI